MRCRGFGVFTVASFGAVSVVAMDSSILNPISVISVENAKQHTQQQKETTIVPETTSTSFPDPLLGVSANAEVPNAAVPTTHDAIETTRLVNSTVATASSMLDHVVPKDISNGDHMTESVNSGITPVSSNSIVDSAELAGSNAKQPFDKIKRSIATIRPMVHNVANTVGSIARTVENTPSTSGKTMTSVANTTTTTTLAPAFKKIKKTAQYAEKVMTGDTFTIIKPATEALNPVTSSMGLMIEAVPNSMDKAISPVASAVTDTVRKASKEPNEISAEVINTIGMSGIIKPVVPAVQTIVGTATSAGKLVIDATSVIDTVAKKNGSLEKTMYNLVTPVSYMVPHEGTVSNSSLSIAATTSAAPAVKAMAKTATSAVNLLTDTAIMIDTVANTKGEIIKMVTPLIETIPNQVTNAVFNSISTAHMAPAVQAIANTAASAVNVLIDATSVVDTISNPSGSIMKTVNGSAEFIVPGAPTVDAIVKTTLSSIKLITDATSIIDTLAKTNGSMEKKVSTLMTPVGDTVRNVNNTAFKTIGLSEIATHMTPRVKAITKAVASTKKLMPYATFKIERAAFAKEKTARILKASVADTLLDKVSNVVSSAIPNSTINTFVTPLVPADKARAKIEQFDESQRTNDKFTTINAVTPIHDTVLSSSNQIIKAIEPLVNEVVTPAANNGSVPYKKTNIVSNAINSTAKAVIDTVATPLAPAVKAFALKEADSAIHPTTHVTSPVMKAVTPITSINTTNLMLKQVTEPVNNALTLVVNTETDAVRNEVHDKIDDTIPNAIKSPIINSAVKAVVTPLVPAIEAINKTAYLIEKTSNATSTNLRTVASNLDTVAYLTGSWVKTVVPNVIAPVTSKVIDTVLSNTIVPSVKSIAKTEISMVNSITDPIPSVEKPVVLLVANTTGSIDRAISNVVTSINDTVAQRVPTLVRRSPVINTAVPPATLAKKEADLPKPTTTDFSSMAPAVITTKVSTDSTTKMMNTTIKKETPATNKVTSTLDTMISNVIQAANFASNSTAMTGSTSQKAAPITLNATTTLTTNEAIQTASSLTHVVEHSSRLKGTHNMTHNATTNSLTEETLQKRDEINSSASLPVTELNGSNANIIDLDLSKSYTRNTKLMPNREKSTTENKLPPLSSLLSPKSWSETERTFVSPTLALKPGSNPESIERPNNIASELNLSTIASPTKSLPSKLEATSVASKTDLPTNSATLPSSMLRPGNMTSQEARAERAENVFQKSSFSTSVLFGVVGLAGCAAIVAIVAYAKHHAPEATSLDDDTRSSTTRAQDSMDSVYTDPLNTRYSSIVMISPNGNGVCIL
ncbi:hypothetical protein CCR75_008627 [Bremia lactucae]|uniref:Uncharacterized protein n=1 Tax=Bremia lactucae TaxID=4779 RepID=A0A976FHY0_BRELC|nr:hypothetical protein CCR75_008627 [Bremia lactucae]